jgi:hypothetical protein
MPPQESGLLLATLDIEQYMFKLSMKSNAIDVMAKPSDVNPISRLWGSMQVRVAQNQQESQYQKLIF